jgi:hypothetical protein
MKIDIEDKIAEANATGKPLELKLVRMTPKLELVKSSGSITDPSQMATAIKDQFKSDQKRMMREEISLVAYRGLILMGRFYRDTEGRLLYVTNGQTYDLVTEKFGFFLQAHTGLRVSNDPAFGFTLSTLKGICAGLKPIKLHSFGYYETATGTVTMNLGGARIDTYTPGEGWQEGLNGDGGLLFHDDDRAELVVPDLQSSGELAKFLGWFSLEATDALTEDEQRALIAIWIIALFFDLPNNMLLPFIGEGGSTKSSAARSIGRQLIGPTFQTTDVGEREQDCIRNIKVALCNNLFVVLDNVDTRIEGLETLLAAWATGTQYVDRQMRTVNEQVRRVPRARGIVTARDARFNRPDVAQRAMPSHFKAPKYTVESDLAVDRSKVIGEIMQLIGKVADSMKCCTAPSFPTFRMSDFARFMWHCCNAGVCGLKDDDCDRLLRKIQQSQANFATDDDSLVWLLNELLDNAEQPNDGNRGFCRRGFIGARDKDDKDGAEITTGQLFTRCKILADSHEWSFYKHPAAFGKKLAALKDSLERVLGAVITFRSARAGSVMVYVERVDESKSGDTREPKF